MKQRIALILVVVAFGAGCQYFTYVQGRVSASDGNTATSCAVAVFDDRFTNPFVECRVDVRMGERFSCSVHANTSQVYRLEVSCSGYERLVRQVPVEACAGKWFSDCDVADVGTLVMTRLP